MGHEGLICRAKVLVYIKQNVYCSFGLMPPVTHCVTLLAAAAANFVSVCMSVTCSSLIWSHTRDFIPSPIPIPCNYVRDCQLWREE